MDELSISIELNNENLIFIENIARFYEAYGIPRIGGRIFALFLLTAIPLSAEKIADLLSASRGSVSTNIRGLIANGWVEKFTYKGNRVEYFRFSESAWEKVLENRMRGLEPLKKIAVQGLSSLPANNPACEQLDGMVFWVELQIKSHEEMIEKLKDLQIQKKSNKF